MAIDFFIEKVADQFENVDYSSFNEFTRFKEAEDWSSLTALFIISMADEEFNVTLKVEDIRNANTIGELFNIINSKIS